MFCDEYSTFPSYFQRDSEGPGPVAERRREPGITEMRGEKELLTIPRQQGSISRETERARGFTRRGGAGGIIRRGHPQFLSRNDLFPLRNKHLSDPLLALLHLTV